jgi:hypothetical protein
MPTRTRSLSGCATRMCDGVPAMKWNGAFGLSLSSTSPSGAE